MTPEQQRIAIATACGWKPCTRCDDPDCAYNSPPNYLNDLNAMHEAEKVLKHPQLNKYYELLAERCGTKGCIKSTASQRAEAFIEVLNLRK